MTTPPAPDALSLADLPVPVGRYLTAHRDRDADAALAVLTPDATIVDDGRTHSGQEAIQAWLGSEASEYSYTIEPITAWRTGDEITVVQRLIGDFPGGTVDLRFTFTLASGRIDRLVIAP